MCVRVRVRGRGRVRVCACVWVCVCVCVCGVCVCVGVCAILLRNDEKQYFKITQVTQRFHVIASAKTKEHELSFALPDKISVKSAKTILPNT